MTQQPLSDEIHDQLEDIQAICGSPQIDDGHREALLEQLEGIQREMSRYQRSNSVERFLTEFIHVAKENELPAGYEKGDDLRPEFEEAKKLDTLCACGLVTCPVNNGHVPPELISHGSGKYTNQRDPEEQMADYLSKHPEAKVIHAAHDVWNEWAGSLASKIQQLTTMALAAQEVSNNPDIDPRDVEIPA